jgi:hypothetical protein
MTYNIICFVPFNNLLIGSPVDLVWSLADWWNPTAGKCLPETVGEEGEVGEDAKTTKTLSEDRPFLIQRISV